MNYLYKIFPFLKWFKELKKAGVLKRDIIAWLSVSFILIPQSMAYAQLAGLPIEVGLYTAFIPVIIAALYWSSPQMSTWPVTIVSLMTATALAPVATAWIEWYVAYASLIAFFTALFYLLIWSLRLGVIVDFLSHPVIVWFTNAAALLTITSQASKIFWVSYEKWSNYFMTLYNLFASIISQTHIPTLVCWITSIIFLVIIGKYFKRVPKILILLLLSISFSYIFWYNNYFWWAIVWSIPSKLPSFSLWFLDIWLSTLWFYDIFRLALFWVIIWLIGFTESISVAKFVSYTTKKPLSPNKELIWQWLANLSSSLFGWYWVAWSFSKTAVNLKSWATTGVTWVITWLMVWFTLLYFTPFLAYLPIATLAAIIIVAVVHMIRFSPLNQAWKIERHDAIIWYVTFFTTLIFTPNIEIWVLIWVSLSLILFIYRSMRPKVIELWLYKDWTYRDIDLFGLKTSKEIWVYRFDGSLYFANAWFFESTILNYIAKKKKISYIILDFEWVNNIDSSAEQMLWNLVTSLKENDIKVYITWIRTKVFEKLTISEFIKNFGDKRIMLNIDEALKRIKRKSDKKIDLSPLLEYEKDKKKDPELEKKLIKKIEKISD
jgi:SulP family sulfate permease